MEQKRETVPLTSGVIAAIGASLCCTAPLVLMLLGVSGSWISGFTLLEPYRPLFLIAVLLSFGYAGWQLYRTQPTCDSEKPCVIPEIQSNRKTLFWIMLIISLALVTSPTWLLWFFK